MLPTGKPTLMASGDPSEAEQNEWIDWTSQLKFEYYLIDEGWAEWKDSWAAIASVSAYAKTTNIKIWIWVHSRKSEIRRQGRNCSAKPSKRELSA